jgi:protein-tyrosine-phosphatase
MLRGQRNRAHGQTAVEDLLTALNQHLVKIEGLLTDAVRTLTPPAVERVRKPQATFEIVVVCTRNRFRSPLAAGLLAAATQELPVRVTSCGTLGADGEAALEEAVAGGRRFGVDVSNHRSRPLRRDELRDADLVLGFERAHVAKAVVDGGAPPDRTFTLPELVELLRFAAPVAGLDPVERAREGVARAARLRAFEHGALAAEFGDPAGTGRRSERAAARRLHDLVAELVAALFAQVPTAATG